MLRHWDILGSHCGYVFQGSKSVLRLQWHSIVGIVSYAFDIVSHIYSCFARSLSCWSAGLYSEAHIYLSIYLSIFIFVEGSLEVTLPTIWTVGKAEVGRVREEKKKVRRSGKREKMQVREKVGKSRFIAFFH